MKIYTKIPFLILELSDIPDNSIYNCFKKIDNDSFKVSMIKRDKNQDILLDEIIINLGEYAGKNSIFEFCYDHSDKYSQVVDFDYISSGRNNPNTILATNSPSNMTPGIAYSSISFYCPSEIGTGNYLVFVNVPVYFDSKVEPIVVDSSVKFFKLVLEQFPIYKEKFALVRAKRNLLINLDPNNSLAYIEAQLDFVTKMLLSIIEASPELKAIVLERVQEYANFKDVFEQTNVFTIKSEHDCYDEIKINKPRVRKYQADYITNKQRLISKK